MNIRNYRSEDCKMILKLFYDTVHSVNSKDYNELQIEAWAPKDLDLAKWDSRLSNTYSVVVEKDNVIVGVGNINNTGYFDLLYTHKDFQGIGVATLIADKIEDYVYCNGIQMIRTDASITAKPFFEKRSYIVQKAQTVETRGQLFINFKMQKMLCK